MVPGKGVELLVQQTAMLQGLLSTLRVLRARIDASNVKLGRGRGASLEAFPGDGATTDGGCWEALLALLMSRRNHPGAFGPAFKS